MRRDLDTVRYILMTAESAEGEVDDSTLCDDAHGIREIAFHAELLRENGLIEAEVSYDGLGSEPLGVVVTGLTWAGYDYLDAIRSSKVWRRAKEAIAKAVGDTSLSVVRDVCKMLALSMVKESLGIWRPSIPLHPRPRKGPCHIHAPRGWTRRRQRHQGRVLAQRRSDW